MFLALLPERNPFGTVFRWFQSLRSYHHRLISSEASGSVSDLDLLLIRTISPYCLLESSNCRHSTAFPCKIQFTSPLLIENDFLVRDFSPSHERDRMNHCTATPSTRLVNDSSIAAQATCASPSTSHSLLTGLCDSRHPLPLPPLSRLI